jgi:terminase small subunit
LAKVGVKRYIDEKLKVLENERTASAKEVLEFLTKSMRGELDEETVVVEGTGDGTSEARIIKKQIGLRERIKSAELLGKRYRLFTDKVEVEGVVPVMIVGESELEE